MTISDPLFQNAIYTIQLAVDDYDLSKNDDRRKNTSIRNMYAGLCLLAKYILKIKSPKNSEGILIYSDFRMKIKNENSEIIYEKKGNRTINYDQTKERFKCLGVYLTWENFDKINKIRNEIEHLCSEEKREYLDQVFVNSLQLIDEMFDNIYQNSAKKCMGDEYYQKLCNISDHYKQRKSDCDKTFGYFRDEIERFDDFLKSIECTICGSEFIKNESQSDKFENIVLKCETCGKSNPHKKSISEYADEVGYIALYISQTKGGDIEWNFISECPDCSNFTFWNPTSECLSKMCKHQSRCRSCGDPIDDQRIDAECESCTESLNQR